ncbi:MAG: hypothetical protein KDK39_03675, partial [Leptospiraceae bacterium]|nr:hypothetical protein [Leptospiraceae bacterium]
MNQILQGIPASEGMAMGVARLLGSMEQLVPLQSLAKGDIPAEIARFEAAIATSRRQVEALLAGSNLDDDLKALFDMQLLLLQDPMLIDQSKEKIQNRRINAEAALASELEILKNSVFSVRDRQISDHFNDLEDIANRLLSNLMGIENGDIRIQQLTEMPPNSILVAETLSPSLMLHINGIAGIALAANQVSDHMVLLARSRDMPVLVGIENVMSLVQTGQPLLLDALSGILIIKPDESYRQMCAHWQQQQSFESTNKVQSPVSTIDGSQIELWCNLGDPGSSQDVRILSTSGVGLFRTEFLYRQTESAVLLIPHYAYTSPLAVIVEK